ncbi:MAG: hypothetical protein WA713_20100, partial [Candidatus Acidiferrales bacterium]
RIPPDRVPTIIPALVAGLSAKGILADTNGHAPAAPAVAPKQDTQTHGTTRTSAPQPAATPPATARVEAFTPPPAATAQISTSATAATQTVPWKPVAIAAAAVVIALSAWAVVHARKPKPNPVPPAPTTATIVLQYASDRHKCTPDLNVTIAGAPYHPATNPFAASGVKIGAQEYTIDGVINCPGRRAIKASGSGAIDVHEGAIFDLAWQAKPGGGSSVDIIRVADNGGADAANRGPNDGNSSAGSQDAPRNSAPSHVVKPAATPVPVPVQASGDAGQQFYLNAQAAYSQGHYFAPLNASALHWAIQSRNAGNQNGKALEAQIVTIYKTQVTQLYAQQNFPAALQLNAAMQSYYPGNPGLLQDQQKILAAANGRAGAVPGAPYPPGYPPQYQPRPGTRPPAPHP